MAGRKISPNLALDQLVAQRIAAGESIVHLGFGESRLPVFAPLRRALTDGADRNAYGPVVGDPDTRDAVAGYFSRRRLPTEADQVIIAPGSKPLLMALQLVVGGDTIVAAPSWVTYAPQARLAGKTVLGVPIPESCGGVPDPTALRETIHAARVLGHDPRILVLTSPDNPTGTHAPDDLVRELCAIAEEEDLLIVSDEIYRDILHTPGTDLLSPAEVAPRRTVVLTGLSKNLALGGWRIGAARFPAGGWGERIRADVAAVASEIWSTLAGPMQSVTRYAFAEPPEIRERLTEDAALHGAVAGAVHRIMVEAGATCRPPTGAFYVYPDFAPLREPLAEQGITDGAGLQRHLLEELGVAVLSGHHFGDRPEALRFRAATSMLYGDTPEQQRQTQTAADPLTVPHVADALVRIEQALAKLPR
ncbi:pyridoxal phosphate-dependent aminotransferase [Micromonospora antibiotica]|uniref:Aminotransferase n=1 Tax=Micromonospora antibiotica TaxID=2807623 RepID=A0ABS3VD80_9ACTN|nr:aminotransferase class I/II-fold pyridoxal phosphate-dependent enzyme [Micromonospora antibiotica]MBO4163571.1 aminotransferase class I/II-fold pyridoxal phosphate-dependent enzyme [Micromonospora antibiotica]